MGLGRTEIDRVIEWLEKHGHDDKEIVDFFAYIATGQERKNEESNTKEDEK